MILDGKIIAGEIYNSLSEEIQKLDTPPAIGVILVGDDDSPSLRYVNRKRHFAEKIGMKFHLVRFAIDVSERTLLEEIEKLNSDSNISGFMVQTPLPKNIDTLNILNAINPKKDIDGFHPENQGKVVIGDASGFTACTPAGIMKIFEYYSIPLTGKEVVIIGRSNIVGKPLANLCINAGATVVSCNSQTPDISFYTKTADIVISAVGKPNLLSAEMVSSGASIIDVGFSIIDGEIHGDTDYTGLLDQGNSVTPVPGGVGPMTVAILLQNTYHAHIQKLGITKS